MNTAMTINLSALDWFNMLTHFLSLSLLSVGGAVTTAPDMHRYLVDERHWLSGTQFNSSIALAQAAPGPNVMYIALVGWNIGMNAGGGLSAGMVAWPTAMLGVLIALVGILLPSTTLTFAVARWGHQNKERRFVRAFKQGMAPVVIALLVSTAWILTASHGSGLHNWPLWLVTALSTVLVWRTKIHLLWLLGASGVMGGLGWI